MAFSGSQDRIAQLVGELRALEDELVAAKERIAAQNLEPFEQRDSEVARKGWYPFVNLGT